MLYSHIIINISIDISCQLKIWIYKRKEKCNRKENNRTIIDNRTDNRNNNVLFNPQVEK